jgi:hypothetical protein
MSKSTMMDKISIANFLSFLTWLDFTDVFVDCLCLLFRHLSIALRCSASTHSFTPKAMNVSQ